MIWGENRNRCGGICRGFVSSAENNESPPRKRRGPSAIFARHFPFKNSSLLPDSERPRAARGGMQPLMQNNPCHQESIRLSGSRQSRADVAANRTSHGQASVCARSRVAELTRAQWNAIIYNFINTSGVESLQPRKIKLEWKLNWIKSTMYVRRRREPSPRRGAPSDALQRRIDENRCHGQRGIEA